MSSIFDEFTGQYAVNKTLRFRLIPVSGTESPHSGEMDLSQLKEPLSKTIEHIKKKKLLQQDEELARKYKLAKKIIDEYHKDHIHQMLSQFKFQEQDLKDFNEIYRQIKQPNPNEDLKEEFVRKQKYLRKKVADFIKKPSLFKAPFVKEILPDWLKTHSIKIENIDDPLAVIEEFKDRTTYFKGFNENRKNIYTDKEHSTAIAYRLIHENLPKFLENIERYKRAKDLNIDFSEVQNPFDIELDELFTLKGFNQCLTQEGIDKYNQVRGGQSQTVNQKEQGINEKINLYAQDLESQIANASDEEKAVLKQQRKAVRSCKLEELYKQILSDRGITSFRLDDLKNDANLCQKIQETFYLNESNHLIGQREYKNEQIEDIQFENYDVTEKLEESLKNLYEAEPSKLYIKNDRAITDISQFLFSEYRLIEKCLEYYVEQNIYPLSKGKVETEALLEKRKKWLNNKSYFSFNEIHSALKLYFEEQYTDEELVSEQNENNKAECEENNEIDTKSIKEQKEIALSKPLFEYFKNLEIKKKNKDNNTFEKLKLLENIKEKSFEAFKVLGRYKNIEDEKLKSDEDGIKHIKAYLDALMDLQYFLKPLHVQLSKRDEKQAEAYIKDSAFYDEFDRLYSVIGQIIPLYNQTRNYLTKKPHSIEKYKLNFENQTLADGWDKNKESANTCVILKKDEQYFLGIMDKNHKNLFQNHLPDDGECYHKMEYKLLPGANKMLPKVFFSQKNIQYYKPSEEILRIRNHSTHTKNGQAQEGFKKKDFNIQDMYKIVDFFKSSIEKHPDWKYFGFEFSPTNKYQDITDFYCEVESQGYKITFQDISKSYIDECVSKDQLYLFQIYSKDFSPKTKGRPNLQTLYWKAVFENSGNGVYQLNGEAELFHRKTSLEYNNEIWKKGHHHNEKRQKYPIIKDRRYAKDTYLFHVPITCNFKESKSISKFNQKVNEVLKTHHDVNIIGIDRGERHLAYYTVIDQSGKILDQASFNDPLGKKNYQKLLEKKEEERNESRKAWDTIEPIKNLKEGYLSQVVHKITKLIVEHNAIVVFEDLNFGFKRGRFKFEKQVYQKLEKALIDKLKYLVFKNEDPDKLSGLRKALQLTAKFESFKKMGKQTGFIFYVPAYHTSKVCPATGFINLLYPKYETIQKAKEFFDRFDKICFNQDEGHFEFHLKYSEFTNKAEGLNQNWTVCTYDHRLENFKDTEQNNQWATKEVILTQETKDLLKNYSIEFEDSDCIKDQIVAQSKSDFFKSLMHLLKLTLQMRNSRINSDEDWLISPIKDDYGQFFDSRHTNDDSMPQNADANGAYHIALKGLLMLQQMSKKEDIKNFKPDLNNKAWYEFLTKLRKNK